MKNIFKIAVVLFGIFALFIVSILYFGKESGEKTVKAFFENVEKCKDNDFDDHVFFLLSNKADPELIHVFFKEVLKICGKFQDLSMNGMSFSDKTDKGSRFQDYSGTFNFAKKSIKIEMNFIDEKLAGFSVKDENVIREALDYCYSGEIKGVETKFAEFGKKFLNQSFVDPDEGAFDLMHEALQKKVGNIKYLEFFRNIRNKVGNIKNIEYQSCKKDSEAEHTIVFSYKCDFERRENVNFTCSIVFSQFKGYVIGWNVGS